MPRSAWAMAHAPGQRRETQPISAGPRQVSEARISRETHGRKLPARLKAIVLHGRVAIHSLERLAASHRDLRRQATTAIVQTLRTTGVLTSRRRGRTVTRRPTAIAALQTTAALTSSHSGRNVTARPTTTTAALRSRALTIRRPHAHTRPRK